LQTSDPDVFNAIGFLACNPEIDGPAPQEVAVVIEQSRNLYQIVENGVVINCVPGARAVLEHLHVHLFRRSIEERPGAVLLHAASLRYGGRRVLLAGSKGAGKTTFALRLMQSGYQLEGDEHVLCSNGHVIARPRACRVKASALSILPDLASVIAGAPSYTDDNNGTIFNVEPTMLASNWRIERGPVDIVIALQPNHGGSSSIRVLPPLALVQLLIPETGLPETGRNAAIAAIAALARDTKAFDLSLGDHAGAVKCMELALNA
jgi:hypothetical protein